MIILMNNHQEITDIIHRLSVHYHACLALIDHNMHYNLDRSAVRFTQIEKAMLDKLAPFKAERGHNSHPRQTVAPFASHDEMFQANRALITFLKRRLSAIDNNDVCSFLSYWVAALQMENDEMANYLPG